MFQRILSAIAYHVNAKRIREMSRHEDDPLGDAFAWMNDRLYERGDYLRDVRDDEDDWFAAMMRALDEHATYINAPCSVVWHDEDEGS